MMMSIITYSIHGMKIVEIIVVDLKLVDVGCSYLRLCILVQSLSRIYIYFLFFRLHG
jgi:hypothetical protein